MKKYIIVFFVIGIFLFVIYKENVKLYEIQSGSMLPVLQVGEIILLVKENNYEKEDIITYQVENSYFITHRIIQTTEEGYITKGDANNTEDKAIVKQEQIQGKVIFHSKLLGTIYHYRYYLLVICVFFIMIQKI